MSSGRDTNRYMLRTKIWQHKDQQEAAALISEPRHPSILVLEISRKESAKTALTRTEAVVALSRRSSLQLEFEQGGQRPLICSHTERAYCGSVCRGPRERSDQKDTEGLTALACCF